MLAMEIAPVTDPAAAGTKVAVKVAACPAFKISPAETPVALKPAPDTVTFEIVTLDVPEFASVTVCVPVLDTFTLPKFKEDALTLSVAAAAFTVSVAALLVALPALLLTTRVNCSLLAAVDSAGVVYVDNVAPLIGAPFIFH